MKTVIYLIIFNLIIYQLNAQTKITGKYSSETKMFETQDQTYWIDRFQQGVARIVRGGYVGLMDSMGKVLCEPKYDKIFPFYGKVATVSLNNKYGLIDSKGKELLPLTWAYLGDFSEGSAFFVDSNGKRGFINDKGAVLFYINYDDLSNFHEGVATFRRNKSFGIVNKSGNEVVLLDDDQDVDKVISKVIDRESSNVKWMLGTQEHYTPLFKFNDELAVHFKKEKNASYKYGYINRQGKFIIPPSFDWAMPFSNGYAIVKKTHKWGVIDKQGNMVLPCEYQSIFSAKSGEFIVCKSKQWGVVNSNNKVVIPFKYQVIKYLFANTYAVYHQDSISQRYLAFMPTDSNSVKKGAWGVFRSNGEQVLPIQYDRISHNDTYGTAEVFWGSTPLYTGVIRNMEDFQFQIFDKEGLITEEKFSYRSLNEGTNVPLRSPTYLELHPSFSIEEMALYVSNVGYVFLDKKGNKRFKQVYDYAEGFRNEYAVFGKNLNQKTVANPFEFVPAKYLKGLMNHKEEIILPFMYEDLINKVYNFYPAKKDGKWGVINKLNEVIIPFEYKTMELTSIGVIVNKNDINEVHAKLGLIDFRGEEILPEKYKDIREVSSGMFSVTLNYQSFLVDKKGNKIKTY